MVEFAIPDTERRNMLWHQGVPDDAFEQDAYRIADRVMASMEPRRYAVQVRLDLMTISKDLALIAIRFVRPS